MAWWMRFSHIMACGIIVCFTAVSASGAAAQAAPQSKILRIAVSRLPQDLFPIGARTSEMSYVRGFTGRSLTIYDKSWAVACELCTNLPTLENGGAKIVT